MKILRKRHKFAIVDRISTLYAEMYDEEPEEEEEKTSEQDLSTDDQGNKRVMQTVDVSPKQLTPPRGSTE
jgi:hypothetical protein